MTLDTGSLAITGYAPSVQIDSSLTLDTGSLAITGYAPDSVVSLPYEVETGLLTIVGYAPSVQIDSDPEIAESAVNITGFAPDLILFQSIEVTSGLLTLFGFAPSADVLNAARGKIIIVSERVPDLQVIETTIGIQITEATPSLRHVVKSLGSIDVQENAVQLKMAY